MADNTETHELPSEETPSPVWCVVANIVHERNFGHGGQEHGIGTKHFPPGAKVYVVSFYWGMGAERVTVVGRHRGSHRYVTMDIGSDQLANWRIQLVYSPYVIQQAHKHCPLASDSEQAKANAERNAGAFVNHEAPVQSTLTRVPSKEAL